MATVPRSEMLRALVLELPERFLGSVARQTRTLWVYEDGAMVRRAVSYSPALYQLLDGALLTAARRNRDHTVGSTLKVDIDVQACRISMHTTAGGPPVSLDEEEEGVYIPELIYGRITNVDDPDDLAPKLPNLFSTEFVIEIADGRLRQKSYKQAFYDNMGKRSKPTTRKCAKSANWTRVTFKPDLPKFNMTELDADIVALMKRRVLDMAGTLGKKVTVELNGEKVPVRSFSDYVQLYIDSASKEGIELPRLYKKVNDCWEVCVTLSEGQFQQVSFVNGIATIRGGTHVNHVTDQITSHLMRVVNKKKHIHIGPHTVKDRLWIFVNALIDNPAFDSLTKEALTFGPECHLPQEFLKTVSKLIMGSNLLSCAESEPNTEVHRTDGSKGTGPLRIPKLEDANDAGGSESEQCTLILTEGESAKALAMAGLSVVGRDKYGVFPLRQCTMLNARGATSTQLRQSRELQSLMEIIGLQLDKDYDSPKDLRYGHLMIMTNQDCDGYHEKGLLINFIHSQWPSLLKAPSFLSEFITPMVKATNIRSEAVKSFYSMPDYETWKKNLGGNASAWSVKYYKGLGTSTAQECRDYFEDIAHHKKDFYWADEKDDEAIELAFDKGKTGERKDWLYNYQPGTCLDRHQKSITYSDFIHKELILFSMADIERSIPSVVDGFKRGQRKVMFCSFKRHLVKEIKVSQFVGFVSEHSAYQYGETSVAHTIIGMAQDFVGSNNISLLEPRGQFGTRNSGGKDAATPKYICTMLPRIARLIFPKDDDVLLNYLHEEGVSIEPSWYMPIIPMVLVNGAEGIGTGWSTFVPNYNPRDTALLRPPLRL
ncbi:DNA topoisomerase 2-like [Triticum urartu]|nr:DNA topoisomerase 2-like [Triticum urartu]